MGLCPVRRKPAPPKKSARGLRQKKTVRDFRFFPHSTCASLGCVFESADLVPCNFLSLFRRSVGGAGHSVRNSLGPLFMVWAQFGYAVGLRLFIAKVPEEAMHFMTVGAAVQVCHLAGGTSSLRDGSCPGFGLDRPHDTLWP